MDNLTKEQVLGEGWELVVENLETKTWMVKKNEFTLITTENGSYTISIRNEASKKIYRGPCKNISTFRDICKLLEI